MNIFRKFLDLFIPKNSNTKTSEPELSNKVLLAELVEHFKDQVEKLSVGEKMLYPMSFNILLHHEDYDSVKQSFPFVLPEVVKMFYKVIKQMANKYPDYEPAAKDWVFQFSSCQMKDVNVADGRTVVVNKGHITTIASLMSVDLRQNNVSVASNTRISIKIQDSNVMNNVNVNWDAISRIDIIGENYFRCKFDHSLNTKSAPSLDTTEPMTDSKSLAVLTYAKDGKTYTYNMIDNLIEICGPQGAAGISSVFIIEQNGILNPHVQIRYLPESRKFQIAVYGKTRLSGRELEISQKGMAKWFPLSNNSKIFINDEVSVKFDVR